MTYIRQPFEPPLPLIASLYQLTLLSQLALLPVEYPETLSGLRA